MIKFIAGIFIILVIFLAAYYMGSKSIDRIMIFCLFASFGIRTNFAFIPVDLLGNRYLQGTFILYLADIPIYYLIGRWLKKRQHWSILKKTKSFKWIKAFIILAFISVLYSYSKQSAFWGSVHLVKYLCLYIVCADYISIDNHRKLIINGISLAVIFESIVSIIQEITGSTVGLYILGEMEGAFRGRYVDGEYSTGIAGTFAHSSDIAFFMLFAIIILLFNIKYFSRVKVLIISALAAFIILLSECRTAIVLALCAFAYFFIKTVGKRKLKKWEVFVATGMILGGVAVVIFEWNHIYAMFALSDFTQSIFNRFAQWEIGWKEILQRPILGHGINNYINVMYSKYPSLYENFFNYRNPIHNIFLQVWFDIGIAGMIIYIKIILTNIKTFTQIELKDAMQVAGVIYLITSIAYGIDGWGAIKEPTFRYLWISLGFINHLSLDNNGYKDAM